MVHWATKNLQRKIIMSFITKIEEAAAKKLRRIFLSANKRADYAVADIVRLEKDLAHAKEKALEESKLAYEAAVQASAKAQKLAQELMIEVRACEERVRDQEEVSKINK